MRDLSDLEIMERIAARLSLDAAARDLGISPATVTRKLAALEKRLGVALVHRTTRAVRLTAAGQAFADKCRAVCAAADEAHAVAAGFRQSFSGTLAVNAPHLFGRLVLAPVVFAFAARHPAVQIRFSLTNHHVDVVMDGVDVVIRTGALEDSSLRARKLGNAKHVVVASQQCIDMHGVPPTLEEVAKKPCLVFGTNATGWKCGAGSGLQVNTALAINDLELLRDAAIEGLGFALLPAFLVTPALKDGRLKRIEVKEKLGSVPVSALFPGHDIPNPCARALADDIATALAHDPNWQ